MKVKKQVNLKLVGLDGNAFVILGAFHAAAEREGWAQEEIDAVINEAKSSNYSHLLSTISDHCQDPVNGVRDDDEDDDDNDDYDD